MEKEPTNRTLELAIATGFTDAKRDRAEIKKSANAAHDSITEIASDLKEMKADVREIKNVILENHERRIADLEAKLA